MTVTVQLRGGLGNQLFQYAAGFAASERLRTPLLLDRSLLPPATVSRNGISRWPEQISSFAHAGEFTGEPGGVDVRSRAQRYRFQLERSVGDSRLSRTLGSRIYARETRESATRFSSLAGPHLRINAYCSAPAFFSDESAVVAGQVRSIRKPGDWYLAEAERLTAAGAVALHVRWGDYLNLRHIYGEISAAYYRRALDLLERQFGPRPVWLFSDDPDGAAEFLSSAIAIDHVAESPEQSTPLENLLLLSGASALVGANSTFSWWAAFLGERAEGSVVFPRPLFGPAGPAEPRDWLLPGWVQVGAA